MIIHVRVEEQTKTTAAPPAAALQPERRNGRWAGYRGLLTARMKELWREPEVVFWVFVFPLLLALGLGIAFRQKPAETSLVVVVAGPETNRAMDLLRKS